jgi:hypothetical protein
VFFPASNDDVWLNNFTVQLTANATVASITNASATSRAWIYGDTTTAASGGVLVIENNSSFSSSSIVAGTATVINVGGASGATITGSIWNSSASSQPALSINTTGTVNIVGSVAGGADSGRNGINVVSGTVNITGNVSGGSGGNLNGNGLFSSGGTTTITGNVVGGTHTGGGGSDMSHGVRISGGVVRITGNITGQGQSSAALGSGNVAGCGAYITGGALTTTGIVNGSSLSYLAPGLFVGGGTVNVNGNAVSSNTNSAIWGNTSFNFSGNILNSATGIVAIYAPVYRIDPVPTNGFIRHARNGTGVGSDAWLYQYTTDSLSAFSMPPVSSVRAGVQFANNTLTGTCLVPSPSSVSFGTLVDNTSGTAVVSVNDLFQIFSTPLSSLTTPNTIGSRIRTAATTEAAGNLIASFTNG